MNSLHVIWIIIGVIFTTYFIISLMYKKLGIGKLENALVVVNGLRFINLKHIMGIVLFGIFPFAMMPELRHLINTIEVPKLHVLIPFVIVFFLSAFISNLSIKKHVNIEKIYAQHYSFSDAWAYFIIRFWFLLFYEFFFRGVLLFMFLDHVTITIAIVCNVVLYMLIHAFDSKKEILGTIPFGIILCLLAYFTNSVWYAFLVHLSLSAVYEISIFYYLTLKNKTIS
ncbi:CPBP family intramembrane glutamic endopeptidase [Hwangdonia seohaensis]